MSIWQKKKSHFKEDKVIGLPVGKLVMAYFYRSSLITFTFPTKNSVIWYQL